MKYSSHCPSLVSKKLAFYLNIYYSNEIRSICLVYFFVFVTACNIFLIALTY